ncbi:uncharacterized protein [Primulina huaijiensis]|uniref:uncharacterized protein n=1 Tax=Primulina huaijiensis TaxID=1492673 RepID=UPI003CC7427A
MDNTLFAYNECLTHESDDFKTVSWLSWDDWRFVRISLFSTSPDLVASALQRIRTWRSRSCIPVAVEVTASIIETQQQDPSLRDDLNESAQQSEEALSMQYCMAIMRLVNGIVEKTRIKNEISIGEAANAIGIPRMLIDIRHEGSHRDLPSLRLLRCASEKAKDWLISYYWEPQEKVIPNQNIQEENLEKKIKHRLQKVAFCQKAKIVVRASNSSLKGKCYKSQLSKMKNRHSKLLKKVLLLYSSFSPQVAHVLLEFLLSALELSNLKEQSEDSQIEQSTESKQTAYDDWKSIVLKLSRREPEFLVTLADTILEKMEGEHRLLENSLKAHGFELLLCLFESLVPHLKILATGSLEESSENQGFLAVKRNASLTGLLHRCLLISFPENKQLMGSALIIACLIGDLSLLHKLKKLSLLGPSDLESNSNPPGEVIPLSQLENSLLCAQEKFELIRQSRINGKAIEPKESNSRPKSCRGVVKSWKPCPIGMLPCTTGFSGRLPFFDCTNESSEVVKLSENKEFRELKQCNKRKVEFAIQDLDENSIKKVKETEPDCESYNRGHISLKGVKGHLIIDGVRTKVGEEEFLAIASSVRLLV